MDNHRLPPQNIEAEESVLGMVLLAMDGHKTIFDFLSPDDFYKTAHQKIFNAALFLHNRNENIDLITVKNNLQESGKLGDVGGVDYLSSIVDNMGFVIDVENYCKIIKSKAALRSLIDTCAEGMNLSFGGGEATEIIDYIQKKILSIQSVPTGREFKDLRSQGTDIINRLAVIKENGAGIGVMSGFDDVYRMTGGFHKSDLIVIAGRPSMGKTAFVINTVKNCASKGVPGAVFELEMSNDQIENRLLADDSRVNLIKFKNGDFDKSDWQKIMDSLGRFENWPLFYDDTPVLTHQQIRQKARLLKHKHNIQYIVVDYLQLMDGNKESDQRRVSEISRSMKLMAKELELPVILLSQINRKCEERADKRPMLSDIRDSGSVEQDADVVMFLYRDEVYNSDTIHKGIAEVNIAKQRNGPTGTVHLKWTCNIGKFENLARGDYEDYRDNY